MERGIQIEQEKHVPSKFDFSQITNFKFKRRMFISSIILSILLIGFFSYFYLFDAKKCSDVECYNSALSDCDRVYFIRDSPNFAWRYEITGKNKNLCDVNVRLLKIKKGDLDFVDIEGNEMSCSVEKLGGNFPEKDMFRCTGLLKEKLQEYLINRMHDYVLQNLGEIKENLKQI